MLTTWAAVLLFVGCLSGNAVGAPSARSHPIVYDDGKFTGELCVAVSWGAD